MRKVQFKKLSHRNAINMSREKLKIGVDATVLAYNKEGIGNFLRQLVINLPHTADLEFVFFVNKKDLSMEDKRTIAGYDIVDVPEVTGFFAGFRNAWTISQLAKRENIHIMFSTHSHLLSILFAPTFWLVHDISPVIKPEFFNIKDNLLKKFFFKFLFKWGVNHAARIITTTNFVKEEIIQEFPKIGDKIAVIGAGPASWIDESISTASERGILKSLKLTPNKYFLSLGTINPRKNIDTLITAYTHLLLSNRKEYGAYKLVIAGKKGWLYDPVFDLVESLSKKHPILRLQENIIFTGFVEDEVAKVLTLNCTALVYPSLYEGFGIPPLEALMLGKEVIISDIPVFKEIYLGIAHFFSALNSDELKFQLLEVIAGANLNSESRLNSLTKRYNWESVSKNFIKEIYNYVET